MEIHILDNDTINKIAAGEVIERPSGIAKELIENAIDAGATAITCEIRDGGTTLLRVTDNGCGIASDQVARAFHRHATSKIQNAEDLHSLATLGFRGEALSSIAAVSEIEMITRERGSLVGVRAVNTGLAPNNTEVIPLEISEVGAPDGTSVIVRNLFYNVPVRKKFLRSAQTEAGYITELIEHLALSHPDISFHYRVNGKEKLHSSGNGNLRELIYRIYGREISKTVLPVEAASEDGSLRLSGFIGRPEISRGSRSFELFFVNGRVLQSEVLSRALEAGYRTDLMQHQFPFAVLYLTMPPGELDVNVHPTKKEVRFTDNQRIYHFLDEAVHQTLHAEELIPRASLRPERERLKEEEAERAALFKEHREPFEALPPAGRESALHEPASAYGSFTAPDKGQESSGKETGGTAKEQDTDGFLFDDSRLRPAPPSVMPASARAETEPEAKTGTDVKAESGAETEPAAAGAETIMFPGADGEEEEPSFRFLAPENVRRYEILGQLFDTYWLIAFEDELLMIDQHAAHEKVNYERLMKHFEESSLRPAPSQQLLPPIVISFAGKEEAVYLEYAEIFASMGYEIEDLGGASYAIRAVPMELYGTVPEELLRDTIDEIMGEKLRGTPQDILSRIATMSCKAAVKGNSRMSRQELTALIDELLSLDNPYHCPHGRPTMIRLSKYEIEKKFKRII
ncbi:DNA mismatch repair endonuclease MutL [Lachnoclostridium sp. Marseille-P6806]|uniref:DNA mismatch repair endonuclease MutL n=1 Tax=Lachnoclostridium sp. Marseille-P6806 TaxID=2364793 RepID=UPI00102F970D|nr:DNA mismatch repair endonuclease MutL [Lachnoclostridium sp. Marseille-P6806]